MESLFCCPVCREQLQREERSYRCSRGHSYDIAKEGYVNLLPANFRHSASPGDDREMVAARTKFLDGGWYEPLRDRLCELSERNSGAGSVLLDAGCGEGYYTAALSDSISRRGGQTLGVDLSKAAVRRAANAVPLLRLPWVPSTVCPWQMPQSTSWSTASHHWRQRNSAGF